MTVKPLKWHGGKSYLASWIIDHMPPHLHYVEPYFGGGAVLLARDPMRDWMASEPGTKLAADKRGCSEVINDAHGELMDFWRVLQDSDLYDAFFNLVNVTPFSEVEFAQACEEPDPGIPGEPLYPDEVVRAARFFVRFRQSRQANGKSFATMSRTRTRGRINEQANSWLSAIDGLADAHARLRGVVILSHDALEVIKSQDGRDTLFYLDPPYVHQTRETTDSYQYEMTDDQHLDLLRLLGGIKGKFILSGYRCKLYDGAADHYGWRRVDREIDNKASGKKQKEKKIESLWMNYSD